MIYLASPYSHDADGVRHHRFLLAREFIYFHLRCDRPKPIFSPIVTCHKLAVVANLPTAVEPWWDYNLSFLRCAEKMWVLNLPGWQQSKGVRMEIDWWLETYPDAITSIYEQEEWKWLEYTRTG